MAQIGTLVRENAVPENSYWTAEFDYVVTTAISVVHGMPRAPKQLWVELRCKTAELGYAVGDRVALVNGNVTCSYNNTSVTVAMSTALPTIVNMSAPGATPVAITAANWVIVVKAEIA